MMVPEVRAVEKPHVAHAVPTYHAPVTRVKDPTHVVREAAPHVTAPPNP